MRLTKSISDNVFLTHRTTVMKFTVHLSCSGIVASWYLRGDASGQVISDSLKRLEERLTTRSCSCSPRVFVRSSIDLSASVHPLLHMHF